MSNLVVECRQLHKVYYSGEQQVVLNGVDLSVGAGERVAIVGSSGSGKTTLLHLLGGLDVADRGEVRVAGKSWGSLSPSVAAKWRNQHLGFIFQFHLLLPEFSALDNVALPLLIRDIPRAAAVDFARDCLAKVGLLAHAHKTPEKLSGGERQRVAVARALVTSPSCILADEPTGNLDRNNAERVFELLLSVSVEDKIALLLVSHDDRLAARTQRVYLLNDGILGEEG